MPVALHIAGLVILLLLSNPVTSFGKIADGIQCAECHTMHASQNGSLMGEGSARESLLLLSCLGERLTLTFRSSTSVASFASRLISCSRRLLVCRIVCASSWFFQNSGWAAFFSSSRTWVRLRSASKIPSNLLYLFVDCVHSDIQLFEH